MEQNPVFIIKWLCIGVLVLLIETSGEGQTPPELYQRLQDSISFNSRHAYHDFSWMTPENRKELVQYIYTNRNNLPDQQFISAEEALLYLGDPATVQERVNAYRKADGSQSIGGPPESILPYLIDDLTHASSENHIPMGYSLMDKSLMCCFEAIVGWPAFPAATREWASDSYHKIGLYYRIGPNTNANRFMREWWEHNKEAVLARQYDKATWLPPASEQVPDGPMAQFQPTPSFVNPSQPVVTPTPQALPSNATGIPLWLYGIVILTIGVLAGLWYFLRAKK